MKEPDLSDISLRELTVRHVKAGYSNVYKYVLVLEAERDALLAVVPKPTHGYITNCPHPHHITLQFNDHDEMLGWLEALAALPENLRGDGDEGGNNG